MSHADATPTALLFTTADHDAITTALPRIARLGGWLEITNATAREGQPETLWITAPGSTRGTIDWTAWREADGVHVERIPTRNGDDMEEGLAVDMADLIRTLLAEWEAAADAREAKARRGGLDSLPGWLRREE
jgi:hypothetical protein